MERKNNVTGILLGLFLVLSLLLGGFIVYDKILKKEDKSKICNFPKEETSFYENMVKNRKTTVDFGKGMEIVLDKDGNVYYKASKVENAVGTKGSYKIEGYEAGIGSDGKISNTLDGYKLNVSNVVAMYNVEFGQAGWRDYILIKADGTIAKLTYSTTDTTVNIEGFKETVSGYKNIVSAVQSNSFDGHSYKLIDINGNIYD